MRTLFFFGIFVKTKAITVKKILLITYYFPPCGGAGVQRWLKMLKYLPQLEVLPYVITVDEQQASYPQMDASLLNDVAPDLHLYKTPTCEVLAAYKRLSPDKEIPYGGFANEARPNFFQKMARFVRGNFFLPDPRRGWNRFAFRQACLLIEAEGIDTVITTSPPHSTQLVGLKLKKKYPHITWVADLRDPWTDIYYNKDLYQTALARTINARYERRVLQQADLVLTVSADCARLFASKTATQQPIVVLPNGFDAADFEQLQPIDNRGRRVISFVGVLSPQHDIEVFCSAMQQLPKDVQDGLLLRFVGKVCPEAKAKLAQLPLQQQYIDYVPHVQAVSYMCATDLLLLTIPAIADNKGILTGKLFEYLAARRPILLLGPADGDAAAIVSACDAGACFEKEQAEALANYIVQQLQQTDTTLTSKAYQTYSRWQIAQQLVQLIQ